MAPSTTYAEATPADRDVAAFIAAHPYDINLFKLPLKVWAARQGDQIVAVLMLNNVSYAALDLIQADPKARRFMTILRLYQMAEKWLKENGVPIICVVIHDSQKHFQSLVRRYGFEKVGEENNVFGIPVETIFAKKLLDERKVA